MINRGNENQDTLGDLVKQPAELQRGYDPYRWQQEERERNAGEYWKDKILVLPDPPEAITIPADPVEINKVVEAHFLKHPLLKKHEADLEAEIQRLGAESPGLDNTALYNKAQENVWSVKILPSIQQKVPSAADMRDAEVARLQGEAAKVRTYIPQDWASVARAMRETAPRGKARGR